MKNQENLPKCCRKAPKRQDKGLLKGIAYGLVPHIGCIAFILFTIIGATTAAAVFRPLLMKSYFFYGLIALSMVFATISAAIYLKRNDSLSGEGIAANKGYLSIMYGTTIAVNLLFFIVIFPLAANMVSGQASQDAQGIQSAQSKLALKVAIPCPGHAPLITGELNKMAGVQGVKFSMPDVFDITFDPAKTTKDEILSLEIFKEYAASVI